MSDKHLTELPWKTLAIKHKLKDTGLQKALLAYSKIDIAKTPALALDFLAEISDQAIKLKKANQANKEVVSYLDEVAKEAAKTKQSLAALPKPKAKGEEKEVEEEEQESHDIKVLLLSALKRVKTAEEPTAFAACIAKPFYGLFVAKSPSEKISPTHKKLLTDLTQGTKFILGRCLFENEAHTFIVDPVPAGLAKQLKKSIKELTGVAYKVRVRDSEGKIVADGDTDVDEDQATGTTPPVQPGATAAPGVAGEAMAAFTTRLKALQPEILKAIGAKTPQGDEIKQRAGEAGLLAGKKEFAQANLALDAVQALLKKMSSATVQQPAQPAAAQPKPAPTPKPATPPAADPVAQPKDIKLSTYLTGRANLRQARENAEKELKRLQQAILAKCADEPFLKDVEAKSQKLFDYLKPIDDSVVNKLDEAGKCSDPERQLELNKEVRKLIQKQLAGIRDHALAGFVVKNPFGDFVIKQSLDVTLSALDNQLS